MYSACDRFASLAFSAFLPAPRSQPARPSCSRLLASSNTERRLRVVRPWQLAECVVDGDTFHAGGQTWRIADIDAPEVFSPEMSRQKALGDRATARLLALLDAGPVTLSPADRDADRYGRKLRILMRDGKSLGLQLCCQQGWRARGMAPATPGALSRAPRYLRGSTSSP